MLILINVFSYKTQIYSIKYKQHIILRKKRGRMLKLSVLQFRVLHTIYLRFLIVVCVPLFLRDKLYSHFFNFVNIHKLISVLHKHHQFYFILYLEKSGILNESILNLVYLSDYNPERTVIFQYITHVHFYKIM